MSTRDNTTANTGPGYAPKAKATYFGALDGFRGLLALLVAVFHTSWESWFNNTDFMDQGTVMIDLFFVFSGFLMFHLYGQRMKTPADGRKFIWRRIARLYPIHFVMTLVFLLYACARVLSHKVGISVHEVGEILPFQSGSSESLWSLYTNLTLTQSMGTNEALTFNPPAWTISTEFFTYFVFAAMLIWARPHKRVHFAAIGAGVIGLYLFLAASKPNMDITYDLGFWRCLAGFYTGVIAAALYGYMQARQTGLAVMKKSTANILEASVLVGYISFTSLCGGSGQFWVGGFALVFVLVFCHDRGFISQMMRAPIFGYLAKISYSVYMVHVIVAIFADVVGTRLIGGWVGNSDWNDSLWGDLYLVPYLAMVIVLAHFSQKYIEVPGAKMIEKFSANLIANSKTSKAVLP